jgi:hypothetical protein
MEAGWLWLKGEGEALGMNKRAALRIKEAAPILDIGLKRAFDDAGQGIGHGNPETAPPVNFGSSG